MARTTVDLFGGTLMSPVPNPYPVYRHLRQHEPVVRIRGWLGDENLITRYSDIEAMLRDPNTFSSRANGKGIGLVMGRTILEMEGREHVRHRNLISPFFSPRALKTNNEERIRQIADELIDVFVADGQADLVAQFAFTFPLRVLAHIVGIAIADFDEFHHRALDLISIADNPAKGLDASQWLRGFLQPIIAERRQERRADLLSALVHGQVDGERLTDDEVTSFFLLLLPAGAETTYRLIGSTMFALLTHVDAFAEVSADRSLVDAALTETLRWESPVQFVSREATAHLTIGGAEIAAGDSLFLALGSANRDETRFADPDRFVLHRQADDHVAFGLGQHFCAGSHLARLEATVAINALLDRLPGLRIDPEAASEVVGLAFRSPNQLRVRFDSV